MPCLTEMCEILFASQLQNHTHSKNVSFSMLSSYFWLPLTVSGISNCDRVRNLKFATSKTLVNFMKKIMFLSKNWYFSVQKALIYYRFNKSRQNSFILLVFSHVANFRYMANFRFLTLHLCHCNRANIHSMFCCLFM